MRNLTKVLALVLSLAFVMTMFAGATATTVNGYSDAATTDAGTEAVSVLSALGIVNGYTDGSYGYEKEVTRAEYAKLIAIAANGDDTTPFYNTEAVSFKDTVDAWAKPYVNYCYLTGILAGYTDGTVKAANPVKGVEAVKMTLVALGYKPEVEGLVGANWINNTVTLAQRAGLLVNLEGENLYTAFDREATAILVYNALYANTVEYVGNSAVATEYTLGEEAFDLLDVRAVVVATDTDSIGLIYNDLLNEGGKYAHTEYVNYKTANSGTTSVVYRDYTGASTVGGYYIPRMITLNVDLSESELGNTYRILTTGCKTPYNTTEVRKVYGIIDAANDGVKETYANASGLTVADATDVIEKMIAMAKKAGKTENDKLDNVFVDGDSVSLAYLRDTWFPANNDSNSPVIICDNDADGAADTVKVYTVKYAEIIDANDTKFVVETGDKTSIVAIADIAGECTVGDWVRYDSLNGWAKIDSVSGTITKAGDSSWTINGVDTSSDCQSAGVMGTANIASVLGGGVAAAGVNATIWYDGSYAVAASTNDNASWQNYGIVIGWNESTYLGLNSVRLYTADNEYADYVVTSINGNQKYDEVVNYAAKIPANTLVKYYVDGNTIALYTWNNDLMIGTQSSTANVVYKTKYDVWSDVNTGVNYTWTDATIFVSVAPMFGVGIEGVDYAEGAYLWRAYKHDEFQPAVDFVADCNGNQMVLNVADNCIKTAAIVGNTRQTLPGLVIGGDEWLTVLGAPSLEYVTSEDGVNTWTYTVKTIVPGTYPNGTATKTIVSSVPMNTMTDGNIYRASIDENGVVTYWAPVANGTALGTNGIELAQMTINGLYTVRGTTWIEVADVLRGTTFTDDLILTEGTEVYFVENLFTENLAIEDDYSVLTTEAMLELAAANNWVVYADVNPTTLEVNTMWVDTAKTSYTKDGYVTLTSYNEETGDAYYDITVDDVYGNTLTKTDVKEEDVKPTTLKMKVGEKIVANVTINSVGAISGWSEKDASNATSVKATINRANGAQAIKFDIDDGITVWNGDPDTVGGQTVVEYEWDLDADVNGAKGTQFWWVRTVNNRVEMIASPVKYGVVGTEAYVSTTDAVQAINDGVVAANLNETDKNAYTFEEVILVDTDEDGKIDIVVLVDNSTVASGYSFPYSAEIPVIA